MKNLTCTQAKQIDLVDYLQSLGHSPVKIHHNDYWYLSPLREERTASFKIDRKLNLWYDHGSGQGGDLIDFGTLYYKCSIGELLARLSGHAFSFHPPIDAISKQPAQVSLAGEKKEAEDSKIIILSSRTIANRSLIEYINSRCIPLEIVTRYCREIDFSLYKKAYKAIGFANYGGGYELRSKNFKGSSSPKSVTFMDNNSGNLTVFEGFFSFLSYLSLYGNNKPQTNYLILNSLSFFQKSIPLMQRHKTINLYLDRDDAGMKYTSQALQISSRFKDDSYLYKQYKDLNQFLISNPPQRQEEPLEDNKPKEISEQKKSPHELPPPFGKGRRI